MASGQQRLAVSAHLPVLAQQVAVSTQYLLGFRVPYDELAVGLLHGVELVDIHALARSASCRTECYLAQTPDLTHHIGRIVGGDDIDVIAALVGAAQLLVRCQLGEKYLARDFIYYFFHNLTQCLQAINPLLHPLSPLVGCARAVKSLPGNRFAYLHPIGFALALIHLIGKQRLGQIGKMPALAEAGYPIETGAVLAQEVHGHHIAAVLDALFDEELVPFYVTYLSVILLPAAQSCGKHDDIVGTSECLVDHHGEVSSLLLA